MHQLCNVVKQSAHLKCQHPNHSICFLLALLRDMRQGPSTTFVQGPTANYYRLIFSLMYKYLMSFLLAYVRLEDRNSIITIRYEKKLSHLRSLSRKQKSIITNVLITYVY